MFVDRKGARMEGAVVRLRAVSLLLENLGEYFSSKLMRVARARVAITDFGAKERLLAV